MGIEPTTTILETVALPLSYGSTRQAFTPFCTFFKLYTISMGRSLWIIAQQNETECGVAQQRQSTWAKVRETQVRGLPPVSKPQPLLSIEKFRRAEELGYR